MLTAYLLLMNLFFFNDTATTEIYTLSLHDALPILMRVEPVPALDHLVVPLGGQVALRRDHAALARAGGRARHRGALGQRHLGFQRQRAEAHPGDVHGNVELERMAGEARAEH